MYLIATHIPIHTDGTRHYTDISWQRDLILARDWLARPYGGLGVIAPALPLQAGDEQGMVLVPIGLGDGIRVFPSFPARNSARQFWLRDRHEWNADVHRALAGTRVFHTSACDVYKPMAFMAQSTAVRVGLPTIFVGPDIDAHSTLPHTVKGRVHCAVYDRWTQRALGQARLGLLKEGLVYDRYHRFGSNVKSFCHTMHSDADVVPSDRLEERLQRLDSKQPLRAVYAGRFVRRKGLHDSVAAIASACKAGALVELHLYGGGPEEPALRAQVATLGIQDKVFFHGVVEYSPAFIQTLAEFDIFLFMPTEEDTPRALFDTMAAGLPLLGTRIPFLEARAATDRQSVLVDIGDTEAAAAQLASLHGHLDQILMLSRNARAGGLRHSVDQWYRVRAEWTREICAPAA
jgi:glycosyltransferase involved in cell wall biosynthesis